MEARLNYPGQKVLNQVEAELAKGAGGAGEIADLERPPAVIAACARAHQTGLSLGARTVALRRWVEAVETLQDRSERGQARANIDLAWVKGAADGFFVSGLVESISLADAALAERACAAADFLAASYSAADQATASEACQLSDRLIEGLPLFTERSVRCRILRGAVTKEPYLLWDLGKRLLDEATDPALVAFGRALTLHDHFLHAHHLMAAEPKTLEEIQELRAVDAALDEEFGDTLVRGARSAGGAVVGAVFNVLSNKRGARRKATIEERTEWQKRVITAAGSRIFGRGGYVDAYATYLEARISACHEDVSKGIKQYREALERGFDPHRCVMELSQLLEYRGKAEEARVVLEHWIPLLEDEWLEKAPGVEVGVLLATYARVGGDPNAIDRKQARKEAEAIAERNRLARKAKATELAAKGGEVRSALLRKFEVNGLALLDAAIGPTAYDAALTRAATGQVAKVAPEAAARLCLDEVPLFVGPNLAGVVRLADGGLPAEQAAQWFLALVETVGTRPGMDWRKLTTLVPNLFKSSRYADRLLSLALRDGRREEAGDLMRHFRQEQVLDEVRGLEAFRPLASLVAEAEGQDAAARLGEGLHSLFTGAQAEAIQADVATRLVQLAKSEKSVSAKVDFLTRATKAQPENAEVKAALAAAQSAQTKKMLIIGAILLAVVVIAALFARFNGPPSAGQGASGSIPSVATERPVASHAPASGASAQPIPRAEPVVQAASQPPEPQTLVPYIEGIKASSTMPDQSGFTFAARQIADGRITTTWQPAANKAGGVGQWIEIRFRTPPTLTGIRLWNGFQVKDKLGDEFLLNSRATGLRVTCSSGAFERSAAVAVDADHRGDQLLEVDPMICQTLRLTVTSVRDGTRWRDLAISELIPLGY